jgi:hypothetical protein
MPIAGTVHVAQEHDRKLKHGVFVPIRLADLPSDAKKSRPHGR